MDWVDLLAELKQRNIRLSLNGDALQYHAPKGTLTPELITAIKQQRTAIINALQAGSNNNAGIERNTSNSAPLTTVQKQIWASYFIQPNQKLNHIPCVVDIKGESHTEVIKSALMAVFQKYDALQIRFRYAGSSIQQYIDEEFDSDWISIVEEDDYIAQTEDYLERRFDLLTQRPHRAVIIVRRTQPIRFIWCFHHIIMDGWSMSVLINELINYLKLSDFGEKSQQTSSRFIDYAASKYAASQASETELAFWHNYLSDIPAHIIQPENKPYPTAISTFSWVIKDSEYYTIQNLAKLYKVSPTVILFSLYQLFIKALNSSDKFAVRMPTAGRTAPGIDRLVGLFASMMLVKADAADAMPLGEFIRSTHQHLTDAYLNSSVPIGLMCKQVKVSPVDAFNDFGFAYYSDFSGQYCFQEIAIQNAVVTPAAYMPKATMHHTNFSLFESNQEIMAELSLSESFYTKALSDANINQIWLTLMHSLYRPGETTILEIVEKARKYLEVGGTQTPKYLPNTKPTNMAEANSTIEARTSKSPAVLIDMIESSLLTIWKELLHTEVMNFDADFFDLGGHSLLIADMHLSIQKRFSVVFDVKDCFKYTSIHALSSHLCKLISAR